MYMRVIGDEICHKQSEARGAGWPLASPADCASAPDCGAPHCVAARALTDPALRPSLLSWAQVGNLYELFHTRASLHSRVCTPTRDEEHPLVSTTPL